jgi:hypothetical protein
MGVCPSPKTLGTRPRQVARRSRCGPIRRRAGRSRAPSTSSRLHRGGSQRPPVTSRMAPSRTRPRRCTTTNGRHHLGRLPRPAEWNGRRHSARLVVLRISGGDLDGDGPRYAAWLTHSPARTQRKLPRTLTISSARCARRSCLRAGWRHPRCRRCRRAPTVSRARCACGRRSLDDGDSPADATPSRPDHLGEFTRVVAAGHASSYPQDIPACGLRA